MCASSSVCACMGLACALACVACILACACAPRPFGLGKQANTQVDPGLKDLLDSLLTKAPNERITLAELREHPWLTRQGVCARVRARASCHWKAL